MATLPNSGRGPHSERRQYRRFDLQYSVNLRFHLNDSPGEIEAFSKNVAVGGLLLKTAVPLPLHTLVGFVMTIQGRQAARPIHLVGNGEVVRVEPEASDLAFAIAVKCSEPISELEGSLPASGR